MESQSTALEIKTQDWVDTNIAVKPGCIARRLAKLSNIKVKYPAPRVHCLLLRGNAMPCAVPSCIMRGICANTLIRPMLTLASGCHSLKSLQLLSATMTSHRFFCLRTLGFLAVFKFHSQQIFCRHSTSYITLSYRKFTTQKQFDNLQTIKCK